MISIGTADSTKVRCVQRQPTVTNASSATGSIGFATEGVTWAEAEAAAAKQAAAAIVRRRIGQRLP
jgi:hypothetical protein